MPVKPKPARPEFFNFGAAALLAVQDAYGLDDPVRYCPILLDGDTATLLSVRSPTSKKVVLRAGPEGRRLFLKQIPWYANEPELLDFSLTFQNLLADQGLPVARIVPDKGGALYSQIADVEFVLFEFVPGYRYEYRASQLAAGARSLAYLHVTQPAGWWRPLRPPSETVFDLAVAHLDLMPVEMSAFTPADRALQERLRARAGNAWSELSRSGFADVPVCGVHGDFNPWNMQFAPDGSVAAVLDFDNCDVQSPLHDVAEALLTWTGLVKYRGYSVRFAPDLPVVTTAALRSAERAARTFLAEYQAGGGTVDGGLLPAVASMIGVEFSALGLLRGDFAPSCHSMLPDWVAAVEQVVAAAATTVATRGGGTAA